MHVIIRISEHRTTSSWFQHAKWIEMEPFASWEDAKDAENAVIRNERPRYNGKPEPLPNRHKLVVRISRDLLDKLHAARLRLPYPPSLKTFVVRGIELALAELDANPKEPSA